MTKGQENPRKNTPLFSLQVLLKERTKIQVTHFPATTSPSEKLRDIKILYQELLATTGNTQSSEQISAQESAGEESDEEQHTKRLFAQEFLQYAEQVGAEAMALLLNDRTSTVFISTNRDAATQNREDMIVALRRTYPHVAR